MKNLSLTKGRQPTKAERKKAAREEAERRAMAKCPIPVPKKPERKPLSKTPKKAPEPGKIYTAAEREKLIQSRPDLQNKMEVSPQDK
ncbi:hypothetical protein [Brevundimonas sp. R86498]|uniref:hypothetical protein n=1 Tax=Brevundimonas sp. R86498 TaxID=3093845 RepID=UPI0037C9E367